MGGVYHYQTFSLLLFFLGVVKYNCQFWFLEISVYDVNTWDNFYIDLFPGEYVASGSDDGRWFIWEKRTGRLIKILVGDGAGKYLPIILKMMNCYFLGSV